MYIQKVLSNGIRVAAERVPYVQSLSMGIWVGNGSRYEKAEENGISHFIEHMVFKGTQNRSARDIAEEMDAVGGQLNAFTTRECTCFYAKTISEYAETAMDILSDMVFSPRLSPEDMETERRVVLEEIAMYEDSPEDVVYDLFALGVWGDTPMGRTILGTPDTLFSFTPDMVRSYMHSHYTAGNIVISVAGSFDDSLFDKLEKYFGGRDVLPDSVRCAAAEYRPARMCLNRDFEQVQLVAGFNGIDIMDESVYPLLVFNNAFGSGMSARLFQNIREKYGLTYSIGAGHSAYIGTGTFDINAAVSPENTERVAELIVKEIKKVKEGGLTPKELERAKVQLRVSYIISNESISARMQALGRAVLLGRPIRTRSEVLDNIAAVDSESVREIIDRILDENTLSVAAAGPLDSTDGLFTF